MSGAPVDKSVIFDMDGTLADVGHRRHHVAERPKNWPAFNAAMHKDPPNTPIIEMARIFADAGWHILICTGREDRYRTVTEEWLARHEVPYERLYMRATADYRPDHVIKLEILGRIRDAGFDPHISVDDRDSVVAMWRAAGLTCLQCAEGDF